MANAVIKDVCHNSCLSNNKSAAFISAVGAEIALVYSSAGTGPVTACRRLFAAAVSAEVACVYRAT